MAEIAFFIMFVAVVIYIVLGNYLYFAKVVPALNESPKLLPWSQWKDVERYLAVVDERRERPWFATILRHTLTISTIYLIGFTITFALMIFE